MKESPFPLMFLLLCGVPVGINKRLRGIADI